MKRKKYNKIVLYFQINSPLLCKVFPSLKFTENFKKPYKMLKLLKKD